MAPAGGPEPQRLLPEPGGLHRLGAETDEQDERRALECVARLAAWAQGNADAAALLSDERMWFSGALHGGYWEAVKAIAESMGFDRMQVYQPGEKLKGLA